MPVHRRNLVRVIGGSRSKFRRWEPGARLPELSNSYCLPGRAGGSPLVIRIVESPEGCGAIKIGGLEVLLTRYQFSALRSLEGQKAIDELVLRLESGHSPPKELVALFRDTLSAAWRAKNVKTVDAPGTTEPNELDPPKIAEFLLIAFATTRYAAHAVGDRNEVFARECKELGRDRAVRRYWADTLRSLRPLLTRAIERALKWGAVTAAFRRLF